MIHEFHTIFRPEPEGGYTVIVPSLPGCVSYGRTLDEAKKMIKDAIGIYVEVLVEDGEVIPSDSEVMTATMRHAPKKSHVKRRVRRKAYAS